MEEKFVGWVRFEGPGKLRMHRWHRVKRSLLGGMVTLCGLFVAASPVGENQGEGLECQTCRRRWLSAKGGHY